ASATRWDRAATDKPPVIEAISATWRSIADFSHPCRLAAKGDVQGKGTPNVAIEDHSSAHLSPKAGLRTRPGSASRLKDRFLQRPFLLLKREALAMLLRVLDRLEEVLIATLIAAATLLIFVAVVHRYAAGIPLLFPLMEPIHLSWAQELCIYM